MVLATAQDLMRRYDQRLLADLAGDEGAPVPPEQSERVQAALDGATGQLLAAVRLGGRYQPAELEELLGPDQELVKDVVCNLALLRLIGVRIHSIGQDAYRCLQEAVQKTLDDLRAGKLLFGTPAVSRATVPDVDGPTALDYQHLNLLPSRVRNYYPSVASRLPLGR